MSEQEQVPNHITSFKVENFKCFDSFEVKDLGLLNVITGENNIGKSSLLEALLLDSEFETAIYSLIQYLANRSDAQINSIVSSYNYSSLIKSYSKADEKNIVAQYNYINSQLKVEIISGKVEKLRNYIFNNDEVDNFGLIKDYDSVIFLYNDKNVRNRIDDLSSFYRSYIKQPDNPRYLPYIWVTANYANDLLGFFSNIQADEKIKKELESSARIIIPDLKYLEITFNKLLKTNDLSVRKKNGELIPLYTYGEGTIKLIRIILELYFCKGKRMLIDEIDTGIYYKFFNKYWTTIVSTAIKNNVQLFVTTHSKECLYYLAEAMEELGEDYQKELRYINMYRNKEDKIVSTTFSYKEFKQALENENEIR